MKKTIFGALVVVAIAVGAMINVSMNQSAKQTSEVTLKNVEALADSEMNWEFIALSTDLKCSGIGTCVLRLPEGWKITADGTKN